MTEVEARREAAALLKDEANELSVFLSKHNEMDTAVPHRAKVAIQREIQRLKDLAKALTGEGC